MKEGSLLCFVVMRFIKLGCFFYRVFGVFGKLLMRRGAWAWFYDVWTWGAKVLGY
jgi:hypothetical protein